MNVGILIVSHDDLGRALLETAAATLGHCPLDVEVLGVSRTDDPESLRPRAERLVRALDTGDGVLVLTDMYGSTPSNIACSLQVPDRVEVIAGINLPMLIRLFNYPTLALSELLEKALSGGAAGVLHCTEPKE